MDRALELTGACPSEGVCCDVAARIGAGGVSVLGELGR